MRAALFYAPQNAYSGINGAQNIGYRLPGAGESVLRTQESVNKQWVHLSDFGGYNNGVGDDTDAIAKAISWGMANGRAIEFSGNILARYINVTNSAYNFNLHFRNVIFYISDTVKSVTPAYDGFIQLINTVDFAITGTAHLRGGNTNNHTCLVRIAAQAGGSQASSRNLVEGLTAIEAELFYKCGTDGLDYQCSENVIRASSMFKVPRLFESLGSQTVTDFEHCRLTSEDNPAFPTTAKRVGIIKGGLCHINGGSITLVENAVNNIAFEVQPCTSVLYQNPYGSLKIIGSPIECSSKFLKVSNPGALTSVSANSSIGIIGVEGYAPSTGPLFIDTASDDAYAGKIYGDNGSCFYGDFVAGVATARTNAHISLGANTVFDMDGCFGASFNKGSAGFVANKYGKPRFKNQIVLSRSGATTLIANTFTDIVFPTAVVTQWSEYGNAVTVGAVTTFTQDLHDVEFFFQAAFASSVPDAAVTVFINGVQYQAYGYRISNTLIGGVFKVPFIAAGQGVKLSAVNSTGGSIALTGGTANFLTISARAA
jgi:hypothetical protein